MANPSISNQMPAFYKEISIIHYKSFLLIEQENRSWLIRPESSPLLLLPFRTDVCSLREAKQFLDERLSQNTKVPDAA